MVLETFFDILTSILIIGSILIFILVVGRIIIKHHKRLDEYYNKINFEFIEKGNLWILLMFPGGKLQLETLYQQKRLVDTLEKIIDKMEKN